MVNIEVFRNGYGVVTARVGDKYVLHMVRLSAREYETYLNDELIETTEFFIADSRALARRAWENFYLHVKYYRWLLE